MRKLENKSVNESEDQPLSNEMLYLKHTDGLRKPTGPFPTASRASLIRVIIDPTTGEEQEVPKTSSNAPSIPVRCLKNGC